MTDVDTILPFWQLLSDVGITIASISTVILVMLLWSQTKMLQKQIRLGSSPKLFPRWVERNKCEKCGFSLKAVLIFNVGKGNAVDVHLEFKDENDKPIGKNIDRYIILTIDILNPDTDQNQIPEYEPTGIWFIGGKFKFKIVGYYKDTNGDLISANNTYEYPPKIIK